ncbi:SNARE associated Golgi protein family [Prunus dulcis]|uniref:SNARE associated Golgi protein family n=1 Tax=Prunus dulcis TaxID=3755 RepID=A0A4Y1R3H0_PRUDU|nr:SNARE associated Golgi protein family [Prunus dulcis]
MSLQNSVYLWNPSIKKIKRLPIGVIQDTTYVVAIGLGFHRGGNDHKVVRVMRFACKENMFGRRICAVPPVSYHVLFPEYNCAFLNGVVYWITTELFQLSTFILSFDLGSEEFKRIISHSF